MSIESIRSSLNALENLAQNLGLDSQDLAQRREALLQGEEQHKADAGQDSVNFTSNSLGRLRTYLGSEEPISHEEAMATLQEVRNAPSGELEQVHGGLDPKRVFALLGMDE